MRTHVSNGAHFSPQAELIVCFLALDCRGQCWGSSDKKDQVQDITLIQRFFSAALTTCAPLGALRTKLCHQESVFKKKTKRVRSSGRQGDR